MNRIRRFLHDFTLAERLLWGLSVCLILIAFLLFDRRDLLTLAALSDPSRLSVIVCFAAFFACDLYGFIAWRRMAARQAASL